MSRDTTENNGEQLKKVVYDPSVGLAVTTSKGETEEDPKEKKKRAVAISGGWVYFATS